jgi:hypothetical protein
MLKSISPNTRKFLVLLGRATGYIQLAMALLAAVWMILVAIGKVDTPDSLPHPLRKMVTTMEKFAPITSSIGVVTLLAVVNVSKMFWTNSEFSGLIGLFAFAKLLGL